MLIYDDVILKDKKTNNYVALGSFDGLHLGHLSLIEKVKELANKNHGNSMVFTFKNHPRDLIRLNEKVELLMTNNEKINILQKANIDILAFRTFNENIMKMQPEDFIKWICKDYNVKGIVVGINFKFGYKNLGDIEVLRKYKQEYNYELVVMEPYKMDGDIISSTRIRRELVAGNIDKVNKMLSRPYSLSGKVIHGKKLGRTIGFPTINMEINPSKIIPAKGVYYTNIIINGEIFKGITSVGNNPTVNGENLTIETYVLNFNNEIYGEEVTLYFISKIRNEIKFNSINELKEQLEKDKNYAINSKVVLNHNFI